MWIACYDRETVSEETGGITTEWFVRAKKECSSAAGVLEGRRRCRRKTANIRRDRPPASSPLLDLTSQGGRRRGRYHHRRSRQPRDRRHRRRRGQGASG